MRVYVPRIVEIPSLVGAAAEYAARKKPTIPKLFIFPSN
jgi:hypothetical protein